MSPENSDSGRIADALLDRLRYRGDGAYFGETVTETQHMLQTAAAVAAARPGNQAMIAAGLLHDIGHLLHDLGEDAAERGIDSRHEQTGADHLARWFGPRVVEPVRLHVAAKRYLCAVDPGYLTGLSPASLRSLALQGGAMTAVEAAAFAAGPHAADAILLRRCDDHGKDPARTCPDLAAYRPILIAALSRR
ncbi:MAG: HD domain-containing protein [Alphaproteobacteria bacterium]